MDLNSLLPQQILFSLKDLQTIGLLKITTAKKYIRLGHISAVKVGVKLFISREEIIRYFKAQEVKSNLVKVPDDVLSDNDRNEGRKNDK